MATYPQLTPTQRARGRFTVREPFAVSPNIEYTCLAVRSFADLYRERIDPYTAVYEPAGLIENTTVNGSVFKFAEEAANGINIITLADDVGNHILIPDNYITSIPTSTGIQYLEFVLSATLGPLPSTMDTITAQQAVIDAIGDQFGIDATVKVHTLPTTTNPTYEEHLALEQARQARVVLGTSNSAQIASLTAALSERDAKITALVQILRDNNLLP